MLVIDTFQRPNGPLGGAWGPINRFSDSGTPSNGGIQITNNAFSPINTGGEAALCAYTGQTFSANQWASAQISAIAAFTSVVHITACTSAAGTSTYTYTLTSGLALVLNQQIYVTSMTNSGNNSPVGGFAVTALGAGTFSVTNASPGANESGSSGTGTSPSDSNCGVAVRCSADGKNGYVIQVGTNSGVVGGGGVSTDHRVYDVELWKVVNGVATFLNNTGVVGGITAIPDSPGDVYTISVVGTTINVYKNGTSIINPVTDADLSSGSPGIGTWSVSGAGEWVNPTVYALGNSGTQWTNFIAGDGVFPSSGTVGSVQLASDNFNRANENPLSQGGNWHQISNFAQLTVTSNTCQQAASANCWEAYTGVSFPQNQYCTATIITCSGASMVVMANASTSAQTFYGFQILSALNASGSHKVIKQVAGAQTTYGAVTFTPLANDVYTVATFNFGSQTLIYAFRNGALVASGVDNSSPLTTGVTALEISGNAGTSSWDNFLAGSFNGIFNNSAGSNSSSSWLTPALANSLRGLKH